MANGIGVRIREARDAAGLTQQALAEAIGCSTKSISLWENTEREPDLKFLRRIAAVTHTPVADLLGEEVPA